MVGRGEYLCGPSHLSDGSLRIMALITLLLLPPQKLPDVIILDEPELGLHPAAEQVIAGLIKYVYRNCQVIISTQSSTFIDHFSADDLRRMVDGKEDRLHLTPTMNPHRRYCGAATLRRKNNSG